MQLLKACEIGAGLFGLMALFGALFAGFSSLAAIAIGIGVAVLILLMCQWGKARRCDASKRKLAPQCFSDFSPERIRPLAVSLKGRPLAGGWIGPLAGWLTSFSYRRPTSRCLLSRARSRS